MAGCQPPGSSLAAGSCAGILPASWSSSAGERTMPPAESQSTRAALTPFPVMGWGEQERNMGIWMWGMLGRSRIRCCRDSLVGEGTGGMLVLFCTAALQALKLFR